MLRVSEKAPQCRVQHREVFDLLLLAPLGFCKATDVGEISAGRRS
jgi:hypothetical protein